MNTHVLLFHIGTPKTGTTALQAFCYSNQDLLNTCGWDYPHIVEKIPCEYELANRYKDNNGWALTDAFLDTSDKGNKIFDQIMQYIVQCLETYNVIISCEQFWWMDLKLFFTKILSYLSIEKIKVLVYLRRQDKFIESYWNQMIKQHRETRTLKQYIRDFDEINGKANYLERLKNIRSIISNKENLIVRIYEKQNSMNIISDFLTVMDIPMKKKRSVDTNIQRGLYHPCLMEVKRIFADCIMKLNIEQKDP